MSGNNNFKFATSKIHRILCKKGGKMPCYRIHHTGKSLLPNCNSLDNVSQPMVCERLAGHEND